jgi:hypothetical protein
MSSEITATAEMLHVVARLGKVLAHLPAVFPTPDDPIVRPLEIGVGRSLHDACMPPDGMTAAKAHAILGDTLRRYVQSQRYRAALAAPGAWRHDLDGNPVTPVSEDHAEFARRQPSAPAKETITVLVSALKVALPIRPEQLHPIDELTKSVDLRLDLGDGQPFVVGFSGRNYRRALRQIEEMTASGGEVIVLLQGRLVAGHKIEGAGLSVQTKLPKAGA